MPPEIAELLDEWPTIDSTTARPVRAAVFSHDPQRLRRVWQLLAGWAELAWVLRLD